MIEHTLLHCDKVRGFGFPGYWLLFTSIPLKTRLPTKCSKRPLLLCATASAGIWKEGYGHAVTADVVSTVTGGCTRMSTCT